MPKQKDLKRIVRTRMAKTGESYTAARLQVLRKKDAPSAPPDYAALAGMSEEAVRKQTGRGWPEWVEVLDRAGAAAMAHRDIAGYVHGLGVPGWWAQTVTVGYERIRGLRAIGQRRSGSWEAKKSRTFPVAVEKLFDAFSKPRFRTRWLAGAKMTVRKETRPKSMRITWADDTSVELWFLAKGGAKSTVAVQHTKLASKADADRMKEYWSERLEALGEVLR